MKIANCKMPFQFTDNSLIFSVLSSARGVITNFQCCLAANMLRHQAISMLVQSSDIIKSLTPILHFNYVKSFFYVDKWNKIKIDCSK